MTFSFKELKISGVFLVENNKFSDARGEFMESYKASEFENNGLNLSFKQDNFSKSEKNVLRGLHYQLNPGAQAKFVRVLQGSIFDVVVDLRAKSATFGQWLGVELNDVSANGLLIPVGCAHGFLAQASNTIVLYKTTEEYAPELERGIIWNDETLKIAWPAAKPVLSTKDATFPAFVQAEKFF